MSPHTSDPAKHVAFVVALFILVVGAIGVFVPSGFVWIAEHSTTSAAFYVVATIRVAFGLILISAASTSRAPRTIRVLGFVILIVGVATALTGLVAMERARGIVEWWSQLGSGVLRLTGVLVLAAGAFVAYACAPTRVHGPGQGESPRS